MSRVTAELERREAVMLGGCGVSDDMSLGCAGCDRPSLGITARVRLGIGGLGERLTGRRVGVSVGGA